ncbi:MAG: LamG-like jellyroll fold domain-containing protein, partial [Prosthecobacter sp.]
MSGLVMLVEARADLSGHGYVDQLAAEAILLVPVAEKIAPPPAQAALLPADYAVLGTWTSAIFWTPHIPATAAVLPDGRLLTFASNQRTTFPDGPQFTYAAVWNPVTGQFTEFNNPSHDMFCGGVSMLQDGRLMVNGGNGITGRTALASLFDWRTNQWTQVQTMADGRWYNTSVALPNGEVLTAGGNVGGTADGTMESWNASTGWRSMSGIPWAVVANPVTPNAIEPNWHPFLLVAPDGKLAHFGPHAALHSINATSTGSMTTPGATIPGTHYPKQGAWAMYEQGKIMVTGGLAAIDSGTVVNKAYKVDLNGPVPVVTSLTSMVNARSFSNSVVLPNGEVMIVGGTSEGTFFSDAGTIYTPEIWNPTTEAWRPLADISVPRNYHSLALLLTDGRVWSGGGGMSGDILTDHQDAQVFTPPQLYNGDGSLATRPQISAAPERIGPGVTFSVNASPGVSYFSFIRLSSQTHSVNTDQRHLRLTHSTPSAGVYSVAAPASINVLTPGYWMLYAVNASGVWSVSRVIQVTNDTLPVVTNPGQQKVVQGAAISLPMNASTATGSLSYMASGLPLGLTLGSTSGVISGTLTAQPGTYQCTVFVTANGQVTTVHFNWVVILPNLGSGQIMREWWTGITGSSVVSLTNHATYPANPQGRDLLGLFEAPSDWDDHIGQRLRGFLHVPVTGQYRFYISSDDQSSLRLSTSSNPGFANEVASVPDWSAPRTYTWDSAQQSALITLTAGTKYYIEALMKENAGGDHLSVAWRKPGDVAPVEIGGTYLSPYLPVDHAAVTWSFDEAAWSGTVGEVKASSQSLYALHGSASGGATTTAVAPALTSNPGSFRSVTLNGVTQSVTVPYNTALNPADFTVAAWVRMDAAAGSARCLLSSSDDTGVTKKGYGLWINASGQWQLRTGAEITALNGNSAVQSEWTHVSASFRTTSVTSSTRTGLRRLYINGVKVAEDTGTYTPNLTLPLVIGAAGSPAASFFQGGVDEVTLYHQPLSPADVITLRDLRHNFSGDQSPIMTNPGPQSTLRNAVVALPISATDPEGATLTFSATGLPTGLTMNAGVISGSPTVAGSFNPVISVTDGSSSPTSITFPWSITEGLTLGSLSGAPKLVNTVVSFTAGAGNGSAPIFKWNFGDGSPETTYSSNPSATHTYTNPGRYLVTLTATDSTNVVITSSYRQAIHAALSVQKPQVSMSIAYEDRATGNDRVWCVNPDNNTVSVFDCVTKSKLAEIAVGVAPRCIAFAPDGRAWVTNTESASISLIDTTSFTVVSTVNFDRGSRPFGLVFNTAGTACGWLALEGTGQILRLNVDTGATLE